MRRLAPLFASFVAVCCLAVPAGGGELAEEAPPGPVFKVGSRAVVVTDSHCGVAGVDKPDHRRCALERTTEGATLVFYDPQREALYRVEYGSEELRFQVLNDFAGLPAWVQGKWDDENFVVQLSAIFPPLRPASVRTLTPAEDGN